MGSNYVATDEPEEVRVDDSSDQREVRCNRCHGTGLVEIYDQETDCIDCEGYGTVLI